MTTTPLSLDNAMQLASKPFALWLRDQAPTPKTTASGSP